MIILTPWESNGDYVIMMTTTTAMIMMKMITKCVLKLHVQDNKYDYILKF
jgi:hypothetical protein